MKSALQWLKNNPILVTAVVLCVAALVMLLIVHFQGRRFQSALTAHTDTVTDIKKYLSYEIKIPAEEIGDPPRKLKLVVNEAVIEMVQKIHGEIQGAYDEIRNQHPTLAMARITEAKDIFPVFRSLFEKEGAPSHG